MSSTAQAADVVVGALVDELVRCGVRDACVCPGSRSTPLAIKLAQHAGLKVWMHLDERSAAFFGLGLARATRRPVVLLATSGTAAANFLPALVEAFLNRVPLIALTADRPHELRDVGAPQTIDQLRLFGAHVKWFVDLPEPEATPDIVRYVRTVAARAVSTALDAPPGPVHLNWPLREPLVPEPSPEPATWGARSERRPYVSVTSGPRAPLPETVASLAEALQSTEHGLIVCGPQDDPDLPAAVTALAVQLGYPVLADPLSGVRCGPHDRSLVLDAYDATLRLPDDAAPEVVLRFGAPPTSKPLTQYLQSQPNARHVLVDGGGGWRDPSALSSDVVHCDARLLCLALADHVAQRGPSAWTERWVRRDRATRHAIGEHLAGLDESFEGAVFPELVSVLPDDATVYVGNSMPVRDLDTFFGSTERPMRLLCNRGANGIDGVVSSAFGAAAGSSGQVALVIGDVSFYHDMNGLLAARRHGLDLLVVVIHNDGGGIFSFLPQADDADHAEHYELLFGTPHGLDFRPFVEGYGGTFTRLSDWAEFGSTAQQALARGGLQVIEVPTDRARNVALHRQVWRAVAAALELVAT